MWAAGWCALGYFLHRCTGHIKYWTSVAPSVSSCSFSIHSKAAIGNRAEDSRWNRQKTSIISANGVWDPCSTQSLRYLALSHCWGANKFLVLKKENYYSFLSDIPVRHPDFNLTFLDAFRVPCDLEYSFLWIDSLCIVQDSIEDWTEQCPLMSDIYANSDCNISATGMAADTYGLFMPNKVRDYAKIQFSPGHEPRDGGKYFLSERGWVIQEHALVSRHLPQSCSITTTNFETSAVTENTPLFPGCGKLDLS